MINKLLEAVKSKRKGFWAKPEKVRKMSVDFPGKLWYVVLLTKGGWQAWHKRNCSRMEKPLSAQMTAGAAQCGTWMRKGNVSEKVSQAPPRQKLPRR